MEVKGQLISAPDPLNCMNRKQRVEQMTELQERRQSLHTLLGSRLAELRCICLQEAELTGEVPNDYPLEAGERPPYIRRRVGTSRYTNKGESSKRSARGRTAVLPSSSCEQHTALESGQRSNSKPRKTLFSGALRRHTESDHNTHHSKRTVHRGCHTDDTVTSESSSPSDSTHNTDEVSRCRPLLLALGRPEGPMGRKLSPVEVYYEIKTRRNSLASCNNSPSRSLPRSVSNLEGRSVPATPLLSRNGPITAHIRAEHSEALQNHKHLPHPHQAPPPPSHRHEAPFPLPHSHDSSSSSGPSEPGGEPGLKCNMDRVGESGVSVNAARHSNSSDILLDCTISSEEEGGRGGMVCPSPRGPTPTRAQTRNRGEQ